jgi:diketogulonate reductase-like aldo/keto reductase
LEREDGFTAQAPKGRGVTGSSPSIKLNNGVAVPALGLGVYGTSGEQTCAAVAAAIAGGYRLIDTATIYGNEREVGEGIARSGHDRAELFVQTKLWMTDYGYEKALRAFDASRERLGLDYVDLYLLHWPTTADFETTIASYRAAERLLRDGLVRAIGISNFSAAHIARLIDSSEIVPAVNQIELHPFFNQRSLRATHQRLGIVTQSWSPLGGVYGSVPDGADAAAYPIGHPVVRDLAAKYGKTPAQLVLRWHLDHGLAAIPKSSREERLAENIDVFDFALSAEEIEAIDALDTGVRHGPDPDTFGSEKASG